MSIKQLAIVLFLILAIGAGMGSAVLLEPENVRLTSDGTSSVVTAQTHEFRGVIHRYSQAVGAQIVISDNTGAYLKTDALRLIDQGDHFGFDYHWFGYFSGGYTATIRVFQANGANQGEELASRTYTVKVDLHNSGGDYDPCGRNGPCG